MGDLEASEAAHVGTENKRKHAQAET